MSLNHSRTIYSQKQFQSQIAGWAGFWSKWQQFRCSLFCNFAEAEVNNFCQSDIWYDIIGLYCFTKFLYNILLEYRTRILYFNTIFLYNILKIVSIYLGHLAQADVKKTFLVRYFLLKCSCCGKFALWCWIYFCLHLDFWWKVLTKVVVFLLRVQFFQRNLLSIMFVWSSVKALCVMCIV